MGNLFENDSSLEKSNCIALRLQNTILHQVKYSISSIYCKNYSVIHNVLLFDIFVYHSLLQGRMVGRPTNNIRGSNYHLSNLKYRFLLYGLDNEKLQPIYF